MNKDYILGLSEGECSFVISIVHSKCYSDKRNNLRARLMFSLTLHKADIMLLKKIQDFFNCGAIYFARNEARFVVENMQHINKKIIPFFDNNQLIGKKYNDYLLWKKALGIFNKGEHLNISGIKKL